MDGVNADSVGCCAVLRSPALVGYTGRIQIKPQPALPIDNGSRLGRGRMRPPVEYVHCPVIDSLGHPYLCHGMAVGILDGTHLLPVTPREFAIYIDQYNSPLEHCPHQYIAQKHTRLFHKKRGV